MAVSFWHRHRCKYGRPTPTTRARFWQNKLAQNVARDRRARRELKKAGWIALVIWQCQTRKTDELKNRLLHFLE